MKLLNIDANAKTIKGQAKGYMTAILYLAPYKAAGLNLCPMAELAGCFAGCLNTAGRGGMAKANATYNPHGVALPDNTIQRARIARTLFFHADQPAFMAQLVSEVLAFTKKAARKGLVPVVRLNGTSDIRWEQIEVNASGWNIFKLFSTVQFYDYTKIPNRRNIPANYSLSISYSGASFTYADMAREAANAQSRNLVAVFAGKLPETFLGRRVVNGDESDLRFLDPAGVVIGLKAKGAARRDTSGFVVRGDIHA